MKIFLSGTSFLSTYGGPAVSIASLAAALAKTGVKTGLWAPDGSSEKLRLTSENNCVVQLQGPLSDAIRTFGKPDLIHDNGIWLMHNHRLATLSRGENTPRLVSTRGMLLPWAMNHKRFKKRIAWFLYQRDDLKSACVLHATSDIEASHLVQCNLGVPVNVIPNGVHPPDFKIDDAFPGRKLAADDDRIKTALFLGRIYPVKGLLMLIEAWGRVRPSSWQLRIAGIDEASYLSQVRAATRIAGIENAVTFPGPLYDKEKSRAFYDSDLFILPSYSESFGMAVAEALAHGLPVLTTKGTPWKILHERNCGWWVEPTVEGLVEGLQIATSLDRNALTNMGSKGQALITEKFNWERVAEAFVSLYEDILQGRTAERNVVHF